MNKRSCTKYNEFSSTLYIHLNQVTDFYCFSTAFRSISGVYRTESPLRIVEWNFSFDPRGYVIYIHKPVTYDVLRWEFQNAKPLILLFLFDLPLHKSSVYFYSRSLNCHVRCPSLGISEFITASSSPRRRSLFSLIPMYIYTLLD